MDLLIFALGLITGVVGVIAIEILELKALLEPLRAPIEFLLGIGP